MGTALGLSTDVYQVLKKRIVDFELMPGQLLMVQELANEMNISRTPVREAMVCLREEGFLVDGAGRKFRVSEITWDFIHDLYQARIVLEGYALENMKNGLRPGLLDDMRNNLAHMKETLTKDDLHDFFDTDAAFHRLIILNSNNAVMANWLAHLNDHQKRIRFLTASMDDRLNNTLIEHTAIYSCIVNQDYRGAAVKLQEHLSAMLTQLRNLCSNKGNFINTVIKGNVDGTAVRNPYSLD